MSASRTLERVAFGLRITGLPQEDALCPHPAEPPWPELALRREHRRVEPVQPVVDGSELLFSIEGGGSLSVGRDTPEVVLVSPEPIPDDALLHPHLTFLAAGRNRLLGRDVFHAGAVVVGDVAWAVTGTNEAGKSTLLAAFDAIGCPVLSDDLVVLAAGDTFAGPRMLDLRREEAPGGAPLTLVRDDQRWRLRLGDAPARVPLAGFVHLRWGDVRAVADVPLGERLRLLTPLRRWAFLPANPSDVLDQAALPSVAFTRPRDHAALLEDAAWLRDVLRGLAG